MTPSEGEATVPASTNQTKLLAVIIVALSAITVLGVVVIASVQPKDSSSPINVIVALMTPILGSLLAVAIHSMATSIDGRMSQLLEAKAKQEHLVGFNQGLAVNPNAALKPSDLPPDVPKP